PVFTFRAGANNGFAAVNEAGMTPIVFNHSAQALPRIVKATQEFRPAVFGLVSSPLLLAMEQFFARSDIDPRELFACYHGFIYGGEPIGPRLKALADAWNIELFETTALGDVVSAVQCRAHDGFHAYEDLAF